LVSNGLPKPDVNKAILTEHGEWLAEPDLSYRDVRLALEYNGRKHANEDRMRRDLTRGVDVSIAGWRTESFGPREVFNRPDQIAALVRRLRQERAHLSRTASR
jgi:very-short-patch-repair endonuclease